ncbi:PP2C family serine/threonine-protein phosphatase [uncultured Ruminococcus sp.]|uniref:PP2C family serine/threonine-protein phosphatase n=1 Tax=uncultured Ruminococcus sp. TaxID=165186 RepID=UPI002620A671|nr:PP2C family serine/threonine-protein phosphatase [uncultured Ruminococcus sp.]
MSKYSSFAHSCIGESHIKKGTVCQDSSLCVSNSKYTFAASADGHGSACYLRTDIGSEYAVDCAQSCVDEFLRNLGEAQANLDNGKERDQLFGQLWRSIVSRWHSMVEEDYRFEPFTQEDLDSIPEQFGYYRERYLAGNFIDAYGTTLAFAVVTDDFAFCAQIGDGSCVALDDNGDAFEPVPEDPRCHDNVTTSMCQDDAAYSARFCYFPKDSIPAVIFLGTDGIENSYCSREQLYGFYRGLALTFSENGLDEGLRQLAAFLPEMTKRGSGDDVTVAGIIDFEQLKAMENSLKTSLEENNSEELSEETEFAPNANADDEKTVAAAKNENTEETSGKE